MSVTTLTQRITSLHVAYAPGFDVAAHGGCRDEALNNLTDELRRHGAGESTDYEKSSHAVS